MAMGNTLSDFFSDQYGQEKFWREIFDGFSEHCFTPLALLDSEFNFIRVNEAYARGDNLEVDDFTGRNHFDLYPNEDNQNIFDNVVRTGIAYSVKAKPFIYSNDSGRGVTYWDWKLTPISNAEGEVKYLVLSLVDVTDLQRAQVQLVENEKKYRYLIDNVNSLIVQWKIDGTIIFFNEFAQKFFGYTEAEIIGRNMMGTVVPYIDTTGKDQLAMIEQISKTPENFTPNENQNMCKDGRRVWISWTNTPLTDENGKIDRILSVGTDISKRKQDESLIKITNSLLNLFISRKSKKEYLNEVCRIIGQWSGFACTGIRTIDQNGHIRFEAWNGFDDNVVRNANLRCTYESCCICRSLSLQADDNADMHFVTNNNSIFIPDFSSYASNIELQDSHILECVNCRYSSVAVVSIQYRGNVLGFIHLADTAANAVNENLIEFLETAAALIAEALYRFDVEAKLSESRERLETLVSAAPIVFFAIDNNGTITLVQGSKIREAGIDTRGILGKNIFEDFASHQDLIEGVRKAGRGRTVKTRVTSFEGFVFDVNFGLVKDLTGAVVSIIGVANDVTDTVKAEKMVLNYQERLRSLMATLVLAEEQERHRIAEQLHDYLGPILSHSIRELRTLEKTLPYGQIDCICTITGYLKDAIARTRDLTFNLSPPSLHNFGLEFAIEELAEKYSQANNIKIDFCCSKERNPIEKQTQILLYRSVRELLVNVVKHANADYIKIDIYNEGAFIYVNVKDNGDGFDVSQLNTPSKKQEGFGLFSIRERLTHIGGNIEIISDVGNGTEVILSAPLAAAVL